MIVSAAGPEVLSGPGRLVNEGEALGLMGKWQRMKEMGEQQVGKRGRMEQEGRPR